jgi:phospholipase C
MGMLGFLAVLAACGGASGSSSNNNGNGSGGNGNGGGGGTGPTDIHAINHVIIMFQENRSFDDYFGQMTAYRQTNSIPINSSDGRINDLSSGSFSNVSPVAGPIASYHTGSVCTEDLTPAWSESHHMMNLSDPSAGGPNSPMNGFVNVAYGISQYAASLGITLADQTGKRAMGYFDDSQLNYYYFMASNFAMSDMFFSPIPARTTENRLFFFAATTQGHAHEPNGTQLTAKPLMQELDANNISWKIYVKDKFPGAGGGLYTYLSYFTYFNKAGVSAHVVPISEYFTDVQAGTLPNVAFIETGQFSGLDEHPSNFNPATKTLSPVNVQAGAAFVETIINALMGSKSWEDSVFFLTWDEGGGLFDHVPPIAVPSPDGIPPQDLVATDPRGDFTITGFRIPNIVVSPFAKKNFVSHTPMDFTAYLKFIETRWGLPPLTQRDASMPDMTEFFDFANPPWVTPPVLPAQNTSGKCNFAAE